MGVPIPALSIGPTVLYTIIDRELLHLPLPEPESWVCQSPALSTGPTVLYTILDRELLHLPLPPLPLQGVPGRESYTARLAQWIGRGIGIPTTRVQSHSLLDTFLNQNRTTLLSIMFF